MNLTAVQKAAAQAIVNIFETGSIRGDYGNVTLMRGDTGQLTYGRSQTTLASGNLFLLIDAYAARKDGALSGAMKPYLPALEDCDTSLNTDMTFRGLLVDAGNDPVMRDVQDAFFDRVYWDPAMRSAEALGVKTPLGAGIVYDSTVHGSFAHMRELTRQAYGELAKVGEQAWMRHYVDVRRNWLASHPNALLHKTVYRMDAFKSIIAEDNWPLALAIIVRGLTITEDALKGADPIKAPAEDAPRRLLRLRSPPLTGPDVAWLQGRLVRAGIRIDANAVFDKATDQAVRDFQKNSDLKADGIVGPATRTALEDLSVTAPAQAAAQDVPMPAVAPAKTKPHSIVVSPAKPAAPKREPPAGHKQTAPAPAATSDDPIAELKQHVSDEVQAGIENIKKSVNDQHAQLLQRILSGDLKGGVAGLLGSVQSGLKDQTLFGRIFSNGRPILAATLSTLTLAFTESRDLLSWTKTTGNVQAPLVPLVQNPAQATGPAQDVYQYMTEARDYATQAYIALHNFAATIPNEWVFRLRVAALALIAYAAVKIAARRKGAKKA